MKQRKVWLAWVLVGVVALAQGAWAQGPGAVRKQVEGGMPEDPAAYVKRVNALLA